MNSVSPSTAAVAGIVAGIAAGLALSTLLTAGKEYQEDISDNVRGSHHSLTPEAIIGRLEREFSVSSIRLHGITKHFVAELHRGLERDGLALKMIPSYVTRRPTGNEQGSYLALDLGGSNFRVCEVALEGAGRTRVRQKKHVIDAELKTGPADALFDFIASRVADFLQSSPESMGDASSPTRPSQKNIQAQKKTYKLGFTFSFPVQQTAINRGTIMYWNKGFDCGSEGKDVVELLQAAFQRQSIDNVEVAALVNDTVGTLIAHAYEDPQTSAAVILGTGTNAAYFEQLSQISKHSTSFSSSSDAEMIINTEWGNFDSARLSLPVTSYDLNLDRATSNPGIQIFEKMISGLYLGEIVRLVLVELVQTGEIFSGKGSDVLNSKGGFESAYMSRIERCVLLSFIASSSFALYRCYALFAWKPPTRSHSKTTATTRKTFPTPRFSSHLSFTFENPPRLTGSS